MSQIFCLSPRCWLDPDGNARLAADGLRLCPQCTKAIAADAIEAGVLHGELELRLSASGAPGEGKPANKPSSREPNEAAVEARAIIQHTLAAWCKLIADERGLHLPRQRCIEVLPWGFIGPPARFWRVTDHPAALAAYIATHATWLAAHPLAGDASGELWELAHGRPRSVAYPGGGRRFPVRDSSGPVPCDRPGCTGVLWALLRQADSLMPSELACDVDDGHRLPAAGWLEYGRRLHQEAA